MNPYTDILLLALVVVYVVDVSGFTESWLDALSRWLGRRVVSLKPFSCSLCMVWWTGIVYALATGTFSIPVLAWTALLSHFSLTISTLFISIREILTKWLTWK